MKRRNLQPILALLTRSSGHHVKLVCEATADDSLAFLTRSVSLCEKFQSPLFLTRSVKYILTESEPFFSNAPLEASPNPGPPVDRKDDYDSLFFRIFFAH